MWLFLSFSSINTCSLSFSPHPFKSYRWGKTMFIDLLFDLVAHQDCVCMHACLSVCVCERDTKKERQRFLECCCGQPYRLKPLKRAHMVFSWDAYLHIEHQGVQTLWKTLSLSNTCETMHTNRHKYVRDVFFSSKFYTPTHSGAAKVTVCWCSSAVINSLTLCVKNSNPTHSSPSLLSFLLLLFPARSRRRLSSLCILGVIPPLWLFSVSMSFSEIFSALFSSSFSVTHSLLVLSAQSF